MNRKSNTVFHCVPGGGLVVRFGERVVKQLAPGEFRGVRLRRSNSLVLLLPEGREEYPGASMVLASRVPDLVRDIRDACKDPVSYPFSDPDQETLMALREQAMALV